MPEAFEKGGEQRGTTRTKDNGFAFLFKLSHEREERK